MSVNLEDYDYIVGYGIGQYYERIKESFSEILKLDAICDKKFEDSGVKEYDGVPIIKKEELTNHKNILVVILLQNYLVQMHIQHELSVKGIPFVHVDEILDNKLTWSGEELKREYPAGYYEDKKGNRIFFDETLPDAMRITFRGINNVLEISKNVVVGKLWICFGNNGTCKIGENTEIIGAEFYVSEARIEIGSDCLLSASIILRNHDGHHIFDKNTHRRINYAKDILIGNQVWIAFQVTLLGGSVIGDGAVVGANSVTSSQFGDHQIIAGVPARVIRENICWSKEGTEFFSRDFLEECLSQDALKYL